MHSNLHNLALKIAVVAKMQYCFALFRKESIKMTGCHEGQSLFCLAKTFITDIY